MQRANHYYFMRSTVNSEEARAEFYTALLVIALFVLFLLGRVSDPLAMLAGGAILLGSGVYQTLRGWHVSLLTCIVGGLLVLSGIGMRVFIVAYLPVNVLNIGLGLVVLYFLARLVMRRLFALTF
ncbi:MAG: hypothetical protein ACUVSX_10620, partial [Aggregatilineales bacterium]